MYKENLIRIVIVEDDITTRNQLSENLEQFGCEVVSVTDNGDDALAIVSKELPDLVLMDIHLNGNKDGIETAAEIAKLFDIPVIYITSYMDNETIDRAAATHPYGYINKPLRYNNLKATMQIAVKNHRKKLDTDLSQKEKIHAEISQHLLNHTFNQFDIGLCFCDENLKIGYKNTKATELINAIDNVSISNHCLKIIDQESREQIEQGIRNNIDMMLNFSNGIDMLLATTKEMEHPSQPANIILFFFSSHRKEQEYQYYFIQFIWLNKKRSNGRTACCQFRQFEGCGRSNGYEIPHRKISHE